MPEIHDVRDDWNPARRCCLECGNSTPTVRLRAITHPTTNQQALACTRHTPTLPVSTAHPPMRRHGP
ncbi:hypothetical protein [Streptomyces sp. GbtcB6]|uniref:hypothetical protein n=1 Tax=Streptomyces sp. GbtcB6 TaxID=2824751 RepID=UPI001C305B60|nr:hypothetical protein [Streptomyces sp. GbtcB6]